MTFSDLGKRLSLKQIRECGPQWKPISYQPMGHPGMDAEGFALSPPAGWQGQEGSIAEVWKDPIRFGWRGKWRRTEWFFQPSAEAAMRAIEREIVERSRERTHI